MDEANLLETIAAEQCYIARLDSERRDACERVAALQARISMGLWNDGSGKASNQATGSL